MVLINSSQINVVFIKGQKEYGVYKRIQDTAREVFIWFS